MRTSEEIEKLVIRFAESIAENDGVTVADNNYENFRCREEFFDFDDSG